TPDTVYVKSNRRYQGYIPEVSYSNDFAMRKVCVNGELSWRGEIISIGKVFHGEILGIIEMENGSFAVYYSTTQIGVIDRTSRKFL
ncbi:MAG: hypothetical protein QM537_07850, partial [Candidatus Symbiobacter sp.]|nr:hypothetical protein [Candidatus Symbiobacter sp.]